MSVRDAGAGVAKQYPFRRRSSMKADLLAKSIVFLGSIGVIAETSDIQREAYNQALGEAGLSWRWERRVYRDLLGLPGGRDRLRLLSDATGAGLSDAQIAAIHARKTELACARIVEDGVNLRPGVEALIASCLECGVTLGLVTSTYPANIAAIEKGAGGRLPLDRFAVVVSRDDVSRGKPDPAAYLHALQRTGYGAEDALAIEDTAVSALSARRAGVEVIVTPGALADEQDFLSHERVFGALATADGGALRDDIRRLIFDDAKGA